jgi:multicomponent Na+:H+ antiporter subunit D
MNGIGRRLPLTTIAFSIGAFGMIGLPPMAGYVSKSYLQQGARAAGEEWVLLVLAASSILNAAYFLPILFRAWFLRPPDQWPTERSFGSWETHWMLLLPPLATSLLVVYSGVFAESGFSPLAWVKLIAARESAQ